MGDGFAFVGAHPCGRLFLPLWEPTLLAMVFRACATPIAHGVGSYKNSSHSG